MNRIIRPHLTPGSNAHSHKGGLRTVAIFEALKGVLALVSAYILIHWIRRDVDFMGAARQVLFHLHMNPGHRWGRELMHAANQISTTSIAMIVGIAVSYATLRCVEGYGLWKDRAWAEWLAIVSGCIYLPFEIYKVIRRPNQFHWVILGINVLVVLYIGWVRWDEIHATRQPATPSPGAGN